MHAAVDGASQHDRRLAKALPDRVREREQGLRVRRVDGLDHDAGAAQLGGRGDQFVGATAVGPPGGGHGTLPSARR